VVAVLQRGDRVPHADVWTAPHQHATVAELAADGPILLLFYLLDWTST
jgi:hypothetical protein